MYKRQTQDKAGKILPVIITYYADKSFDFVIKTPPVAIQLLELAKIKSGSAAVSYTHLTRKFFTSRP